MTSFDRVRPRTAPRPATPPATVDAEGKRALFSAASDMVVPSVGSALVECSRCGAGTVLGPLRALRASIPSIHLAVRVGHGDDVRSLGLGDRDYPSYMRCPACNRPSWVRFTWQV
ncbi:MAG TPA: hypothetical protein VHA79_05560 [Mycobacteriales bacterium]|nr:hypothetical protein [Mycobacteriales bacterium]HVX69140.1 hypothetical protein [Mycobacteriales bacterium]